MYILIEIGINNKRANLFVAKEKKILKEYLRKKDYYYSKKIKRWIDDKFVGDGGSGVDYIIDGIKELKE